MEKQKRLRRTLLQVNQKTIQADTTIINQSIREKMKTINYLSTVIILFGFLTVGAIAQGHDHSDSNNKKTKNHGMSEKMGMHKDKNDKNPLIRNGEIDLKSIDKTRMEKYIRTRWIGM